MNSKKRVLVLLSGRGSNFISLYNFSQTKDSPFSIIGVISDKEQAPGLAKAKELGIETKCITRRAKEISKEQFFHEITIAAKIFNPDIIVLAGFMRVISSEFISTFPNKIINIHPSLLPKFKGLNAQKQALDAGETEFGCTVHFVNEFLDDGLIIAQAKVLINNHDSVETLSERILTAEHKLLPAVINSFAKNNFIINQNMIEFISKDDFPNDLDLLFPTEKK